MLIHSWTRDCCISWRLCGAAGCILTRQLSSSYKCTLTLKSGDFETHGMCSWWICCCCSSTWVDLLSQWYSLKIGATTWFCDFCLWCHTFFALILNLLVNRLKWNFCQVCITCWIILTPTLNAIRPTFSNYLTYSKSCVCCGFECILYHLVLQSLNSLLFIL